MPNLSWLPVDPEWKTRLAALPSCGARVGELQSLANHALDFIQTGLLNRRLSSIEGELPELRVAILCSSTIDQLIPGLRVAALRHGYDLRIYIPAYSQYRQEILDRASDLYKFAPDVTLFSLDARHFIGSAFIGDHESAEAHVRQSVAQLAALWQQLLTNCPCQVIQQSLLPVFAGLTGSAEHRSPGSPATMIEAANRQIREAAMGSGVDVCAIDERIAADGLFQWYGPALWHRAKQEITPAASPLYGELILRLIDAQRGRSAKCLVLDLDNTLWGGVIGDDGLEGIELGQGSAGGEAFVDFQLWLKALSQRGVVLAVSSKNDEHNAREVFRDHPEMILQEGDISAFAVNWDDKATNIRKIALSLNLGLDSIAFVDDNPFERNIVRRELPMVRVPELSDDPALWPFELSASGYFEAIEVTTEDLQRSQLYQATRALREDPVPTTDLNAYLKSLEMRLFFDDFGPVSIKRVTQLINKTNQFNLTTRRYTDAETAAMLADPALLKLHFRLVDRLADHGIISVVIARPVDEETLEIDTWLMSCRVLGRGVENAVLRVLVDRALELGFSRLLGRYFPTQKNGIVRLHYANLGFDAGEALENGETSWCLNLDRPVAEVETIEIAGQD